MFTFRADSGVVSASSTWALADRFKRIGISRKQFQ
jgi:hypothetical protein